ncbi:MAG: hypothetical protein E6K52_11110 [Gammaproteobacteria bacterium]|nr:MAG: hypothetical protein E6K52_11110 [Gammaproteobacteria bacterium]
MRSLWVTAAVLAAALAVDGCKQKKREPVPGPQARPGTTAQARARAAGDDSDPHRTRHGGASGISWFQGTVEEAFSSTCAESRSMFRY